MVVAKCLLQISRLYRFVDELSSLKIGLRLEDGDYELKNLQRIECFKIGHILATRDQLYV